ncbi:hypothetical protein AMS64_12445 [Aeromonas veronii]|uniref:DUF6404 family protein n=1 Tax=Aeromonas veronii TaxID=654 RepID=UPI00078C701F|nr:DUF6404 family protein [Aeromonas veronii]AMQ43110.1 hypothetical protein AMS64_12445 [Aeromonas veronii]MCX0425055.1 DUF6404 family protein [Aeromonas veronii]MCX0449088.1 DUF6404 family protein [Aeromonas veronii]POG19775.1 hypothetical protein C2849_06360 [Aeromonas veronii]
MTFEEQLAAAHQELASKGVWHANYNPPLCRLVRRFGYPVQPPHYEGWLTNVLIFGVGIGLVWGMVMWFFSWQPMGIDPLFALRQTTLFAGFFGLIMASWLWLRRKQLKLTPWEQLAEPSDADDEGDKLNESP